MPTQNPGEIVIAGTGTIYHAPEGVVLPNYLTDALDPDFLAVGFTTDYVAAIPGGTVARCNPVNGPEGCVSAELDTVYTPLAPPPTVPPSSTTTTTTAPTDAVDPADGAQPVDGSASYTG